MDTTDCPLAKEKKLTRKHLHYAVDLDGTLAVYDRWRGHTHIGEPIQPMVNRVKQLLADGHYVSIFTARVAVATNESVDEGIKNTIAEWCRMHIGQVLPITAVKKPYFHAILDDRAEQILLNDGRDAALEFRNLALKMLEAMVASSLDPVVLTAEFARLDALVYPLKEIETP